MSIITVRTEKNLNQLLEKVYVGLKPTEMKRVQEAVLKENPHLLDATNFKPGAIIVLPDRGEGAKIPASRESQAADGVELLVDAIKNYAPLLERELALAQDALEQTGKTFNSTGFKRVLGELGAEESALVKDFELALKEEIVTNKDDLNSFAKNMDELQSDLSQLLKQVG